VPIAATIVVASEPCRVVGYSWYMRTGILADLASRTEALVADGLFKAERVITSPQSAHIALTDGSQVLNLCANNYLGLADHPALVEAAAEGLHEHGFGMASVRFICGTQDVHKELEARLSAFLGTDDTILYSSCFDANGGLFETILDDANNDMADLERCLEESSGARRRLMATEGVFSMDGVVADLTRICDLADAHDALVMVDDSHAVGVLGAHGRGTPELREVTGRIDILTGTLGKALGGASGGYTSGRREIVEWLRQRSRPYLFSNSLAPMIVATTLAALDLLEASDDLRDRLRHNSVRFRSALSSAGFVLSGADHPIVPVMLGDARLAGAMAERLLDHGVHVVAFSHPVVPQGLARIRTQLSAAHTDDDIDRAVAAFVAVGRELGVL